MLVILDLCGGFLMAGSDPLRTSAYLAAYRCLEPDWSGSNGCMFYVETQSEKRWNGHEWVYRTCNAYCENQGSVCLKAQKNTDKDTGKCTRDATKAE